MENEVKKKRLSALAWTCIYLVLVIVFLCSGGLIFHSTYYRSIFVSGTSMSPTLLGANEKANFGIIDTTSWAKSRIKRFDIVTTYFPWSVDSEDPNSSHPFNGDYSYESAQAGDYSVADGRSPEYKIKRVIALGGETIFYFTNVANRGNFPEELLNDIIIMHSRDDNQDGVDDGTGDIIAIYGDTVESFTTGGITYNVQKLPFSRKTIYGRISISPIAVPEGRYFVMGDNWTSGGSSDCGTSYMPIYYDNVVGVLVAIEGTCTISGDTGNKKCTDRHYIVPTVY